MAYRNRGSFLPPRVVGIDWSNQDTLGLQHAVLGDGRDLCSQQYPAVPFGSSALRSAMRDGIAMESTSTSTSGFYIPQRGFTTTFSEVSIFGIFEIDSWVQYSGLVTIPYANGTWNTPYAALTFGRNSSTNNIRLEAPTTALAHSFGSISITGGNRYAIGVTRTANVATLNVDGVTEISSIGSVGAFSNANLQPFCILNRSNSSPGEGVDGRCPIVYIWNRGIGADALERVRRAPWSLLKTWEMPTYAPVAPSAPTLVSASAINIAATAARARVTFTR